MPLILKDEFKQVLSKLLNLHKESQRELYTALKAIKPAFSSKSVIAQISSQISSIEQSDLREIVFAIIILYRILDKNDLTSEQLTEEIIGSVDHNEEQSDSARVFLADILSIGNSLAITSKASEVIAQHENPLRSVRILTDLRPIFSIGNDPKISAGMVVHNLKLNVGLREESTSIFVALDARDIRALRDEIDRAIKKESEIKELAKNATLSYIDIE